MCRKLILLVLVLSFCLTSSLPAYTIILVSDNKNTENTDPVTGGPRDQVWIDLLEGAGYTVDLSFANQEGRTLDSTKIDALEAADLIIVSRNTDSGSYNNGQEGTQWNSITTPLIQQSAFLYRNNRWMWLDSASTAGTTANLSAVLPEHPIFAGVALDASNQVGIVTDNTDVGDTTDPGNGTLIAVRSDNNGAWIVEWEEGVEYYAGSGQTAGGPRMYLPTGHGGDNRDGQYNLTAEGDKLFLNAVSYMIAAGIHLKAYKPDPEDGATGVIFPLLQWTKGETAVFHDVYLGTNPTPGAAEYAGRLDRPMHYVPAGFAAGTTYYWRVDEVEIDGTTIHTGDVWSFSTPFLSAHNPDPPDGAKYVEVDADLSWTAGFTAVFHDVYFGTDETEVADGTGGTFKVNQPTTTYDPGTLAKETTYYWRIDEVEQDRTTKHTGEVWSFSTTPDIPITDPDLLCWWKFDEGEGTTALDWSGHDHHGTLVDDPQWVEGMVGGALEFDGVGDRVVDDDGEDFLNGLDAITVCMWIKSDLIGTDRGFINAEPPDGADNYITMRYDNAGGNSGNDDCMKMAVTTTSGESQLESSANTQVTEWQHVAMTWSSGGLIRFYLNGIEDAGADRNNPNNTGTISGCNTLIIGAGSKDQDAPNSGWDGLIDDVRIFNKALTEDEIKEAMRGEPDLAWNPKPANKSTTDIDKASPLSWSPGDRAAKHDVYLGTEEDAVVDADTGTTGIYRGRQDPNTYTAPEGIEFNQTYYWRIDEFNTDATISKGRVWSFTVADYLIIDDFEDYDDYCNRVFYTWQEGWGYSGDLACGVAPIGGNRSGSTVGYLDAPYAEQTITHDGSFQSMPFEYLNDGSTGKALYSETERTFEFPQDFTRHGMKSLTLWFQGRAGSVGSFSYDPAGDVYTMTGSGTDIWDVPDFTGAGAGDYHDEFHYAYKQLSGVGSIEVRVLSVENTNGWAKAGVMIRETLDANSVHTMVCMTPSNGVALQARPLTGDASLNTAVSGITVPHWVRLTRSGNTFTGQHSADGLTWETIGTESIAMSANVYVGLSLTSHNAGATCEATFSNVRTTGTVTGQWQSQDIGIASNDAERLYVALEDSTGTVKDVPHPDANSVQLDTWQEWNIDLAEFAPVDLTKVKKIYIGVGNRNVPTFGGSGMLYIDDIRLYAPRCMPSLVKPTADFNSNCIVDYPDLDILAGYWLEIGPWDIDGGYDGSGCLQFDGIDDQVYAAEASIPTSAFTIALWFNSDVALDSSSPRADFVYWQQPARPHVTFNKSGTGEIGVWPAIGGDFDGPLTTTNSWSADTWYFIVGTFDGTDFKIYVGENLENTVNHPGAHDAASGLFIGSNRGNGNNFDGKIDDLRIYDYALSNAEITNLANTTGEPAVGPVIWYKFDETSGNIAYDSSGNGCDADVLFDWLTTNLYEDNIIDFKDFAVLADSWLEEELWP